MAAYRRVYVTCRLTAKNRDQLRNPTLGDRVWATFYLLCIATDRLATYWKLAALVLSRLAAGVDRESTETAAVLIGGPPT